MKTLIKNLDSLERSFADSLPKSILQAAVQGKLVPQNVHDEPAHKLLARIQKEKTQLVKSGKIKQQKPLPPIADDETPYDLPDGWAWCRLGEIIKIGDNLNIHTALKSDAIVHYVDIDAIDNSSFTITNEKKLPVSQLSSRARRVLQKDDIAYSLVRPYLNNIAIISEDKKNYIGSTGLAVFCPLIIPNKYIVFVLLSDYIRQHYLGLMSGFNSPGISQENFLATPFPLPPLAEQRRIVAKVDELMVLCGEVKAVMVGQA